MRENMYPLGMFKLLVFAVTGVFSISTGFAQSNLTHGHQVLLDKGLQISGFVQIYDYAWSGDYGQFSQTLWNQSGFSSITMISGALYKYQIARGLPGGEDAYNWNTWVSSETANYTESDPVYALNLIAIQYGDEQEDFYSNRSAYAAKVATLKANNSGSMVYLNQGVSSVGFKMTNDITQSMLNTYTQTVKPDMLNFTEYPFRWEGTDYLLGNEDGRTGMYVHMEMYRKAGLAGLTGDGSQPIPVGMYAQTYVDLGPYTNDRVPSESELRLQQFAGWAFGMKSVQAYVYTDRSALSAVQNIFFTDSGTAPNLSLEPTESFYQYAELNRQSANLGDALVRLISTDVRMKMGYHEDGTPNPLPASASAGVAVQAWDSTSNPYLKNITATNIGTLNNGFSGDVLVGFFKPLDASLVEAGAEDDVYFMIVNGLTEPTGDAEDCRQSIHMEFDFSGTEITQLLRKNRDTGEVEAVELLPEGGSLYSLDLILDGGTGDLFKFDTGTSFIPEPATMTICVSGIVVLIFRKKSFIHGISSQILQPSNNRI